MPEMLVDVRWPDGSEQRFYSPSLVVTEHLAEHAAYSVDDFLTRSGTALAEASRRVEEKYGFPCGRAAASWRQLQDRAAAQSGEVTVVAFHGHK